MPWGRGQVKPLKTKKTALKAPDIHHLPDFLLSLHMELFWTQQGQLSGHQAPLQINTELQKGVSGVLDQRPYTSSALHGPLPLFLFSFPHGGEYSVVLSRGLTVSSHLMKLFMSQKTKLHLDFAKPPSITAVHLQMANFSFAVCSYSRDGGGGGR